jgi:uncharacterized membrane protein
MALGRVVWRPAGAHRVRNLRLTNLAVARHWSWSAAAVDVAWGAFVTGLAGAISVLAADWSLGEA